MLSKRVIALSPDKAFAKRMAAGVMAAGATVETFTSLEELPKGEIKADLAVVHVAEKAGMIIDQITGRLLSETQLIAVIPSSSLESTVKVMMSGKVAACLVADTFEPAQLSKVASRLLYGDVFGLEKMVPWGVKVYSVLVGDYQEKSVAIAAVSDFAAAMGVRRKYRESIEQCMDELLMNALYDAPVDATGKQTFAEVPTKTRISLRMEQKAIVQYACDGNTFALSVRDSFGTLKSDTVIKYLDKCLHSEQQIDRKTGGAGLGLYIISSASTEFVLAIYPGVATEATCMFDLNAPKVQLKEFGIFKEKIDSSGRLVGGPPQRAGVAPPGAAIPVPATTMAPANTKGITALLSAAIVLLLALIAVVAYPRLKSTPRGTIAITSTPSGAKIEVDSVDKGVTGEQPIQVPELDVGQKYKVLAHRDGYDDAIEIVSPRDTGTTEIVLTLHPQGATVHVTSTPSGASLFVDDKEVGATPQLLTSLNPNSEHKARLKKIGYAELTTTFHVPDPGQKSEVPFMLQQAADVSSLRIESDPAGADVYQGAEIIAGVKTPIAEQIVQVGKTYTFTVKLPGYAPVSKTVTIKSGPTEPLVVSLKPGGTLTVETNLTNESRISVLDVPACGGRVGPTIDCPLENGSYKVKITSLRPYFSDTVDVTINGTDTRKKIDLGVVETANNDVSFQIPGAPADIHKAAFSDGDHKVTLVTKTGETITKGVHVYVGRTVRVEATPN
jgi:hypothetical protein